MSLRKCPDCGADVSSAAIACPHCGRPNRRSSAPIGFSGVLAATVGYNRRLFVLRVQNRDSFAWSHCELSINAQGVSSGYMRPVETIRPGITAAALLASAEFVDGDGHRFDAVTQQVATLGVACETPSGHRSYEGKFGPQR